MLLHLSYYLLCWCQCLSWVRLLIRNKRKKSNKNRNKNKIIKNVDLITRVDLQKVWIHKQYVLTIRPYLKIILFPVFWMINILCLLYRQKLCTYQNLIPSFQRPYIITSTPLLRSLYLKQSRKLRYFLKHFCSHEILLYFILSNISIDCVCFVSKVKEQNPFKRILSF